MITSVEKRNGAVVDFSTTNIVQAIEKAAAAVGKELGTMPTMIANSIAEELSNQGLTMVNVEVIQDYVERKLMAVDFDAAKAYIIYRREHEQMRMETEGPERSARIMSELVIRSKYSIPVPHERGGGLLRLESWSEIADRCIGMHLRKGLIFASDATEILKYVRAKKVTPSMRSMQFGGEAIERNNAKMYNCCFTLVDRPRAFSEILYLLLCGCGVGYSVRKEFVGSLPVVKAPRLETVSFHQVQDSIEGWANAVNHLIDGYFSGFYPEFDYSPIRPKGSPISSCAGKAPGHVPLKRAIESMRSILEESAGRRLRPIDAHDMICIGSEAMESGGTRRSALLSLFSPDDAAMMTAKTGDWFTKHPYRRMSNNSVSLTKEDYSHSIVDSVFEACRQFGEPGMYFADEPHHGPNPCGEIGLDPRTDDGRTGFGFCNLTDINCATVDGHSDLMRRVQIATLLGTAQATYTDFKYLEEASKEVAERDALIGVGLTGLLDQGTQRWSVDTLNMAAKNVVSLNEQYARKMGINPAKRCTTIKPSGNGSIALGCVASGCHPHHAKRYFRRVLVNSDEPVFEMFRRANPHAVEPLKNGRDWIFTFPIQAPEGAKVLDDTNALEMLQWVLKLHKSWVVPGTREGKLTHSVSCSVAVKDDEWERVANSVKYHQKELRAVTFFPWAGDKTYANAPREKVEGPLDEERFTSLMRYLRDPNYEGVLASVVSAHRVEAGCDADGRCEIKDRA